MYRFKKVNILSRAIFAFTLPVLLAVFFSGCQNATNYTPQSGVSILFAYPAYENGVQKTQVPVYMSTDNRIISIITAASGNGTPDKSYSAEYKITFVDGRHYGDLTLYSNREVRGTVDLGTTYSFYLSEDEYETIKSAFASR